MDEVVEAEQQEGLMCTSIRDKGLCRLVEAREEEAEPQPMTTAWSKSTATKEPNRADLLGRS